MTGGEPRAPLSLELMLFRAGGIAFGVECGQVAGIVSQEEAAARGIDLLDAVELLGLSSSIDPNRSRCRVVLLKGDAEGTGVRIEGPDEFLMAGAGQIFPLPALLAATIAVPAIRAVALVDGAFILLADFARASLK